MEGSRISILENFPLVSHVMPYYGFTHRMFLLLSALSKGSRQMLIENYKVFRRIMLNYSLKFNINIKDLERLHIPCDLFKFKIEPISEDSVTDLISFVNTWLYILQNY